MSYRSTVFALFLSFLLPIILSTQIYDIFNCCYYNYYIHYFYSTYKYLLLCPLSAALVYMHLVLAPWD